MLEALEAQGRQKGRPITRLPGFPTNGVGTPRRRGKAWRYGTLAEPVGAFAEEFEEVEVAEDLALLADFVGDVGVFGMEFG